MRRAERGFAVLEVVAALAILALSGVALVELASGGTRALTAAGERERELADQDRLLTAYALLDRNDLDLRLGGRDVGDYRVVVERPEPALYRVAISRRASADVEDLVTVLHRAPELTRAP